MPEALALQARFWVPKLLTTIFGRMESNKQLLRVLETISGTMIMIGTIFSKSSDCLFANKSVSNPKIIQRKLKKVINKATQAILDKA